MWVNWMSRGMPTRPSLRATEARDPACARCGGPLSETPPVAVPDLCGACITALHRAFEDRCRWESLAADTLAREAHQRRLGYADTDDAHDYDALPPLDRSRRDAAAAVCLRSLDPEWRRVALDRAADRLVDVIGEAAPVLAAYADASDVTRATKVRHLATAILNIYHQTLDGCRPLSPLEGVQFERRQEAAVATCAICLARVDVDRVVVRGGRWICDDCEAEGER